GRLAQRMPVRVDDNHTDAHSVLLNVAVLCIRNALFPSTDTLHGAGYPHGDDCWSVIPGVLATPLQCRRELRQLSELLAIAIGRFRQLGEVRRGLKGASLIVRRRDPVVLGT